MCPFVYVCVFCLGWGSGCFYLGLHDAACVYVTPGVASSLLTPLGVCEPGALRPLCSQRGAFVAVGSLFQIDINP